MLITNVQNGQRFCHHCAHAVCPTFLPHVVFTEEDVTLLRAMGVDPEVGKIEAHLRGHVKYKMKRVQYDNHDGSVSIGTNAGRVIGLNFRGKLTLCIAAKKITKRKM